MSESRPEQSGGHRRVTAIVLAGGRARRFGADKLVAHLGGVALLSRAIAAVEAVADGVVVVGPALPPGFRPGEVPVAAVPDPVPSGGPLVALAHALELEPDPSGSLAIVVGGDMPALVPTVLAAMLERLGSEPTVDAVLLESPASERKQVLPLALRVEPARRAAQSMLASRDRSLHALIDRLLAAELSAGAWRALDPAGDTLVDVDSPSDLERLQAEHRRHSSG